MKNNKKIIAIAISVLGLILIVYGVVGYINNKNKQNNNTNNTNINNKEERESQDDYDPNSYNEYRDLEGLEKKLIISDFKYENKDGKCEFSFTITNNKEEKISNQLLKVNFYDKNKNLLNTFEYTIVELGVHDRIGIKYNVEETGEAAIFDYEFDNEKIEIK